MKIFFSRLQRKHKVLFPLGVFFVLLLLIVFIRELQTIKQTQGVAKIGVIPIETVIFSSELLLEQIDNFIKDEEIFAIVLKINSPGGAVAPVQDVFQKLLKVREHKAIYTSIGALAASGGYYLAAASDKIFANKGSIVGSIGVIFQYIRYGDLLKKIGVSPVVIKAGKHKDLISPYRELSLEERNFIQDIVNESHEQFIADIALGRGVAKAAIVSLADGRIFSGTQAKGHGLIDEIGGLDDLVNYLIEKHQFRDIKLVYPEKDWKSYWSDFVVLLGLNPLENLQLSGLLSIYTL